VSRDPSDRHLSSALKIGRGWFLRRRGETDAGGSEDEAEGSGQDPGFGMFGQSVIRPSG